MRLGRCGVVLLISLTVSLAALAGACGSGTSQPTKRPSPQPSATALTDKEVLTRYLAEFGKWDAAEWKAADAMTPLFNKVRKHWWDLSSAEKHKAAQTALLVARKFDRLSVTYATLTPPPYLAKSQATYVKFLRLTYEGLLHYQTYLENGGTDDSEWKSSTRDFNAASAAFRQWAFAVHVAAKRLNVKIPFKIEAD